MEFVQLNLLLLMLVVVGNSHKISLADNNFVHKSDTGDSDDYYMINMTVIAFDENSITCSFIDINRNKKDCTNMLHKSFTIPCTFHKGPNRFHSLGKNSHWVCEFAHAVNNYKIWATTIEKLTTCSIKCDTVKINDNVYYDYDTCIVDIVFQTSSFWLLVYYIFYLAKLVLLILLIAGAIMLLWEMVLFRKKKQAGTFRKKY